MNWKLIVGGCVVVLVSIGFVFPQIAQLRIAGAIGPSGVALLLSGVLGTLGGLWFVGRGLLHGRSAAAS
jgi:hypothetical protein